MTRAGIPELLAAGAHGRPWLLHDGPVVTTLDATFGQLVHGLHSPRNGGGALSSAITCRGRLPGPPAAGVTQPLPGGGGNFGPGFGPANGQPEAQ